MGDVIDLAVEREKRDRAARTELMEVIGAAILIGLGAYVLVYHVLPQLRAAAARPQ